MEKFVRKVMSPFVMPAWLWVVVVLFFTRHVFFEDATDTVDLVFSLLGWTCIIAGIVAWVWRYVNKRPFQVAVLHYLTEYPVSKQRGIFRDTTPVRYHNLNVETDPVITFDMTRGDVPKEGEK